MTAISPLWRVVGSTVSSCARKGLGPLGSGSSSRASSVVAASASASAGTSHSLPPHHNLGSSARHEDQRRSFSVWVDVVNMKPQKQGGRFSKQKESQKHQNQSSESTSTTAAGYVHEDPEHIVWRHTDELRSDGVPLLDLMFYNDRHEKAWRRRQRLKGMKRYAFDKKHVNDLAKYIAFVKDHKDTTK